MTIKQQIFNFVKSQNRPVTRSEIVNFYCTLNHTFITTPSSCQHLAKSLSSTNGYLLQGKNCLTKIARNQYIA